MKWYTATALIMFVLACGESPAPSEEPVDTSIAETEEIIPEADFYLSVTDSIGIEIGDSSYVFGSIASAKYAPDGNIFVVDSRKAAVLFFSPDGEFIRQVGRSGSGPGEFTLPNDAAFFDDGRFIVANNGARMFTVFDENFEFLYNLTDFFPSPPFAITSVEGSRLVGMKPDFEQNEDGMFMGFTVSCWNDSGQVEATYFSEMSPFDPTDLSSMGEDMANFAAAGNGMVFIAPTSTEEYMIIALSPEGEELFRIERDFERVRKTQDEMDRETEIVNSRMVQNGMPPDMANWEPDPYRFSIGSMFVDTDDRLWVTRGTVSSSYFDVYNLDGNHLFTAAVDPGLDFEYTATIVSEGSFLAFNPNPEDYPKIYLLSLSGNEAIPSE